jgi:hypothetical protein
MIFLRLLAIIISLIYPSDKWYKVVLYISNLSRFLTFQLLNKNKSIGMIRANHINGLLAVLTWTGKSFPVPYRITGLENLQQKNGLILCTVHLPLVKVAVRGLIENNFKINAAIAENAIKNNKMSVWGIADKIPVLLKNPFVLVKTRSILKNNGTVVMMIDDSRTGEFSPNIMRLCGKVGAKIVFFFAELTQDDNINCYFVNPPNENCENENSINENLDFLRQKKNEILGRYKNL